jgi:hypothetical protein
VVLGELTSHLLDEGREILPSSLADWLLEEELHVLERSQSS